MILRFFKSQGSFLNWAVITHSDNKFWKKVLVEFWKVTKYFILWGWKELWISVPCNTLGWELDSVLIWNSLVLCCICQLLKAALGSNANPPVWGWEGKIWLSAWDHRESDAVSAGQMLREVVSRKQRVWHQLFISVCKASPAASLPGEVKPEQVVVLGKTFTSWKGSAAVQEGRLCSAVLGWKLLTVHMWWYLYNGWLYKMQKLTLLMGHQLILANKIHTLPTGTVGQHASLVMAA